MIDLSPVAVDDEGGAFAGLFHEAKLEHDDVGNVKINRPAFCIQKGDEFFGDRSRQ